jgi:hypothetical protein
VVLCLTVTYNKCPPPSGVPEKGQWVWHQRMRLVFTTQAILFWSGWKLNRAGTPGSIMVVRGISAPRKTRHIPGNDTLSTDRYINVARILLTALESSAVVYHAKGVDGHQLRGNLDTYPSELAREKSGSDWPCMDATGH